MFKLSRLIPFFIGLILGILCTIYLPGYVRPYLPEALVGREPVVKGTIAAKQIKGNSLLLTVNTSEGALLATFTKKTDEVNLLVSEGDKIQFVLRKYKPFIDDPVIVRVEKVQQVPPPAEAPAEKKTNETKKHPLEKPRAAAPSSGKAADAH